MNNNRYPFLRSVSFTLLLATLFLLSCRKQELHSSNFLSLDKTSIRIDTLPGSSETITVHSSILWTSVVSTGAASWLQLDKTSGGPGNTVIKVTGTQNGGAATPQTATVTFGPANDYLFQRIVLTVTRKGYSFSIGYSKLLGGSNFESARSISTPDGGIVLAGATSSADGDVHGSHGKEDAWIVKLNSAGDTVWTRTLGGTGDDEASAIITTPDGGYLVTGSTDSEDGDITDKRPYFNKDAWVMKLDGTGHLVWSKTFGSFGFDAGYSVIAAADGGWLVAGVAGNNNGDVTGYHGGGDVWVLKLDNHGDRQWAKSYGGSGWDEAHNIIAVPDGYVLAGLTNSADGDVTGYHKPTFLGSDILLVKIDLSGNKIWAKAFGGTHDETATGLAAATDGYVVAGYTTSRDGDVTGNHGQFDLYNDMWVLKVNASGNIVWAKAFGGSHDDAATSITGTPDGGFVLTGATSSNDGDVTGNHNSDGNYDCWIVKLDAGGNKQWAKALGGSDDDAAYSVTVNPDGYTISGSTLSSDGDISGRQKGQYDIWAVKLIVQ